MTTSWSQVLAARSGHSTESRDALAALCQAYWYPLYAFVRRQGHDAEASRDLTQAYFTKLLEKDYLQDFDRTVARFRTFLKTSMRNFLSKERDKAGALKRGGDTTIIPLEANEAEARYGLEPAERTTPEEVFERRWALMMLERAMSRLGSEFAEAGKPEEFERLKRSSTRGHRIMYWPIRTTSGMVSTRTLASTEKPL